MRISILLLLGSVALLAACHSAPRQQTLANPPFTDEYTSPYTLPLHQGRTSTCWAYAANGLLESAWLQAHPGDTLRLSPMYVVRQKYLKQLEGYYYSQGREEIRAGGLAHDYLNVAREEGLMTLDAYPGKPVGQPRHDHHRLLKALRKLAAMAVVRRDLPTYRAKAEALLDRALGAVPDSFLFRGQSYTPRSFARSLQLPLEDYEQLTSFSHRPEGSSYVLEVPDNWAHGIFLNVSLDELERRVVQALQRGEAVAWHGDVSEPSYQSPQGVAWWPQSPVTAAMRQRAYEQFATTDDHYLLLVGLAHDAAGRRFYLLKDSYGRYAPYRGLIYMSADYFRMKTLSVLLKACS